MEIMIPLIGSATEFTDQKNLIDNIIKKVKQEKDADGLNILVGSMIEVPRAGKPRTYF